MKYTFSAGPAKLPDRVMRRIQTEFLDYAGTGVSIVETSHRSKIFEDLIFRATVDMKDLLGVGDDYSVLFLQGGARTHFSLIPMNFARKKIAFVECGSWSSCAVSAVGSHFDFEVVSRSMNISDIGDVDADYLYLCSNETIEGLQFKNFPETDLPIVCDMSSDILAREVDASKFSLIFASAQKNLSIAGLTVLVIKNSFLDEANDLPGMLSYVKLRDSNSMLNTPPIFAIYVASLVLEDLKDLGGVTAQEKVNIRKAEMLYDMIDGSGGFYVSSLDKRFRSITNVVFGIHDSALEGKFLDEAFKVGLLGLKGHRKVGGLRASIYNSMPVEGVERLVEFMESFKRRS